MTAFEKSKANRKARQERNKAIRAKYGSLNEWKKKCFFSMQTLKARGWNKELVKKLLGKYDETTSGSYRACDLWLKNRVFEAEKKPGVKAAMKLTLKRSEKIQEAIFDVEDRIKTEVATWDIKLITPAEAVRRMKKRPTYKSLPLSFLKELSLSHLRQATCAELKPKVLAQPKYQRIYRNAVSARVHNMSLKYV